MKSADIKVGESYAYQDHKWSSTRKFTVARIEQGRIQKKGYRYGTRATTLVFGALEGATDERQTEPRYLTEPWDVYAKRTAENLAARTAYEAEQAVAQARHAVLVEALQARLVETGHRALYGHQTAKAVRTGRVEIDLDILAQLLGLSV